MVPGHDLSLARCGNPDQVLTCNDLHYKILDAPMSFCSWGCSSASKVACLGAVQTLGINYPMENEHCSLAKLNELGIAQVCIL